MTDPVQVHFVQLFCCSKCSNIHLNGYAEDGKTVVARMQMAPDAAIHVSTYLMGLALSMTGGASAFVEAIPLTPTPVSDAELQEMLGENDGGETKH